MKKQKQWYAIAYDKRPNGMVSQPFKKKEDCEKLLPLFKKKGWTGGIVRVNPPKPMSEEEKKELEILSKALEKINKSMGSYLK